MANEFAITAEKEDGENINQDLDFELELIHRDMINVMYIIALLQDLKPQSESYKKDRELIIQTLDKDPDLRSKSKLIDDFIKKHIDGRTDEELSQDIEADLDKFVMGERNKAINKLAEDEGVDNTYLHKYGADQEYFGKPQNEIIKECIEPLKLSFRDGQAKKKSLITKITDIIKLFNWN